MSHGTWPQREASMEHGSLRYVTVAAVAGLLLTGCAGTRIQQLSGPAFLKQAEQTDQVGSFAWTSYIGSTQLRAYLEYGHPAFVGSGIQTTVYWTPLSELPSNVVAQIRTGTRPWTNWMDRVGVGRKSTEPAPSTNAPAYTGKTVTYVVGEMDSVPSITLLWGVPAAEIRRLNGLQSDSLKPGMRLLVPVEDVERARARGGQQR